MRRRCEVAMVASLLCLLCMLSNVVCAETTLGDNIVLREQVENYFDSIDCCASYRVVKMRWDPSSIRPEDFDISSEMEEKIDSYGGHTYIWSNGTQELFVSDYGYAGFKTQKGTAVEDIISWYGGVSELQLESIDFDFATREDAVSSADSFLAMLQIDNAQNIGIYSMSEAVADDRAKDMRNDGYEETVNALSDTYIMTYAILIDELYCDTEFFTMANQRDIEGIMITVMVDEDGVQYLDCSGAVYKIQETQNPKDTPIITYDEMLRILSNRFENLILSEPIEIYEAKLQYVLIPTSDDQMVYTPCWCFATPRGSSNRYVWYRFNAYTGDEII